MNLNTILGTRRCLGHFESLIYCLKSELQTKN